MQRRLPKRGFTPLQRKEYTIVNLGQLDVFEAGTTIDMELMLKFGLVGKMLDGVKILAKGELTKSLSVKAHKFSTAAKDKIIALGGTIEEI